MNIARQRFSALAAFLCGAALVVGALTAGPARAETPTCACGVECWVELPGFPSGFDAAVVPCLVVRPGDPVLFCVGARRVAVPCTPECKSQCAEAPIWLGNIARPPFLQPAGHRSGKGYTKLCVNQIVRNVGQPGCYWMKFLARNTTGVKWNECKVKICLLPPLCDEPATCEIETPDGTAATHEGPPIDIIVCAQAGCEEVHGVAVGVDLPGFLGLLGEFRNADGDCCYHYQVFPCETDTGDFQICWDAFNSDGGKSTGGCCVDITID